MAEYLRIAGLRKTFGHEVAVDRLSFGVEKGRILTLLGPSGCGKTTTLRCIAGLEHPDAGLITIDGEPMTSVADGVVVPPERRSVGVVFQSYAVWPHMTVFQNVAYPLEVRKWPRGEVGRRVDEVLAMVGLGRFRDQYATKLSGGQQQRVALARALIFNPRVLLFDEPLSNLDAKLREQLRLEIVRVQREVGITSIYVTHDQAEAMVISDEIIVMNHGRIEQRGNARSIYARPANRFVAEFIGLANLLAGEVVTAAGADGLMRAEVRLGPEGRAALTAWTPDAVAPGMPVIVSIRPEDVELAGGEPAGPDNRLEGRVVSAVYMGSHVDYQIDVGGARIRAQAKATVSYGEGEPVTLRLPPLACVCIPEASPADPPTATR
jgi:iron(III) transport system ATP-binding protein